MKNLVIFLILCFSLLLASCNSNENSIIDPSIEPSNDVVLDKSHVFPEIIALPDNFNPEGIAVGKGSSFYAGSLVNGAVYKGDLRTGSGNIIYPGAVGKIAVGLSFDERSNYLFVAGGAAGNGYVIDGNSGELITTFNLPGGVFINDVVVTRGAAYFTDSFKPVLYRVTLGPAGRLPASNSVEEIQLTGDYQFIPNAPSPNGINGNGIDATPNGKYLIINNMADGVLFKVDAKTGETTKIETGSETFFFGDGLLLHGHILYVVQNFFNQISVVNLSSDFTSGVVQDVITHPGFDLPTTAARHGNSLYVVNAKFTTPNPVEFNIVKVSR